MKTFEAFGMEYFVLPFPGKECEGCDAEEDIALCKTLAKNGCTGIYKIKNRCNLKLVNHPTVWKIQ